MDQPSSFTGLFTRPLARYALAVGVAVAAFLARYLLSELFGSRAAYITFYPAVMVAAVLGGFWPGLLATGLSGLLTAVWILAPVGQLKIEDTADIISLAMFLGMGVFMSAVASLYRGARERAAAYDSTRAALESEESFHAAAAARPTAAARVPGAMRVFKQRLAFDVCLVLTLVLLTTVGFLSHRNMTASIAADRWEIHTYQVVDELGGLYSALSEVENSQRGFIITGAKNYYDQYAAGLGLVERHLEVLRGLTQDNSRQQQRLGAIERLLAERLALLKDILDLRAAKGLEAASTAVMTGRGQQIMDNLRQLVDQARQEEEQLLKARNAAKESSTNDTIHWVVLGAALGGIVLVVAFALLKLEFSRRQRVEQELRVHRDRLTDLVDLRTQELQREQEALRESEERLRITLTSIGDAVIATDAAGRVTFLNSVAAVLTGWRPEEARGQPAPGVFRIINEQTREPGVDIVAQVLREKRVVALANHTSLLARDGRECPIEDSAAPILDATGNLTGVVLVFHDVTERRRAQAALEKSERQSRFLADMLERSDQPFGVGYPDGRLGIVNGAFERLTGYSRQELQAMDWARVLTPAKWIDVERAKLEELHRTGVPVRYEKEYLRKDGTLVPIELLVHLVKDEQGQPQHYYSFLADLTERQRAEAALVQSEEQYRTLFSTLIEGFCVIEVLFDADDRPNDYRFLEINPAFAAQTGLPNAQGKRMRELAPDHEASWFELYGRVALTGEPTRFVNEAKALKRWFDVCAYRIGGQGSRKVAILFNDITERKRAEAALAESEARFKAIASRTPDHILVQDRELRYLFVVNPQLGLNERDMIGKTDHDFLAPADADHLTQIKRRVLETGQPVHVEAPLISPTGERQFFDGSYVPKFDTGGQIDGLIGYFKNVTESKRMEEALRESETTLRGILNATDESIWLFSPDGRVLMGNATAFRRMGQPEGKIVGKQFHEFLPADLAEARAARVRQVVDSRQSLVFEDERNGIEFHHHFYPVRDGEGRVTAIACYSRDITESKRAEEQLRELTRRLTYHVDNSPLAVIEWGPDMRLTRWSGEAEHIFGWKADEVLGKRMEDFRWIYHEDATQVAEVSGELQTGATPRRFSANRNYRKDGSIAHCEWYNSSLIDAAGQLRSILSLVLDVTARKQAEAELQKRAEELRVINEEQEHLNRAMVGRELRMIELKQEVNEACTQAGQPPRYREDFDHG